MSYLPTWSLASAKDVFDAGCECVMETLVERVFIEYRVVLVDDGLENRDTVWERRVFFGATDATHAGGADFVQAAREQERVAHGIVFDRSGQERTS